MNQDASGLSYRRKFRMMLCPWDIICHCLSLCLAMLPASCFITPHLLTAFEAFADTLETNRHGYPTLPDRESERLCNDAQPPALLLTLLATSCVVPAPPFYCQAINTELVDEGWQQSLWAPILDRYMSGWQHDKACSFGSREKFIIWKTDKANFLCWTCEKSWDSATTQLAADKEHC